MMLKKMTLVLHDTAWTRRKSSMQGTIQMLSNNNHCFDVAKSGGNLLAHSCGISVCKPRSYHTLCVCVCVCCRDHTNENLWDSCSPSWERKRASHPLYSHSMTQTDSLINRYLKQARFKDASYVWMDPAKVCMCVGEKYWVWCVYIKMHGGGECAWHNGSH